MGIYLNSRSAEDMYRKETERPYFVDKTMIIKDLLSLTNPYICITRPRRFGKSIMATLIASFFGKATKGSLFDNLKIANDTECMKHSNKYNVIFSLNE